MELERNKGNNPQLSNAVEALPAATLNEWIQRAMQWKAIADAEASKCYGELIPDLRRLRTENKRLKRLLDMNCIAY